jgi:ABC-2 type transport system permease protein
MKKSIIIANRDFRTYFTSPIGYLFLSSFLFIVGFMFYQRLIFFVRQSLIGSQMGQPMNASLNDSIIKPLYGTINLLFLFLVPLITMRLIAEEKKQKTIELLLTSPITTAEIIAGKFLSAMGLIGLTLLCTLIYPLILYVGGNPDNGQIFSMYIGLMLLSACYVSVGIFWSSLTENQIIAAVLTFVSLLFLWVVDWAAQSSGQLMTSVIYYLSIMRHFESFGEGVISLKDSVYYVSFCVFALYLACLGIESRNWKN